MLLCFDPQGHHTTVTKYKMLPLEFLFFIFFNLLLHELHVGQLADNTTSEKRTKKLNPVTTFKIKYLLAKTRN